MCSILLQKKIIPPPPPPGPSGPDTVKPGNYYPVWPGSYWKYREKSGSTSIDSTWRNWQLFTYCDKAFICENAVKSYVPFMKGEPIYGYQWLFYYQPPFGGYYQKRNFLAEKPGVPLSITRFCDTRMGQPCSWEIIEFNSKKTNVKGDSVIIIKGRYGYKPPDILPQDTSITKHWTTYREYTKNVGLTWHVIYDTLRHDTVTNRRLIEYKIGKH